MPEIVECLGRAEASSERTDCATQARNGPLSGLAQVRLEFAERHLDRILSLRYAANQSLAARAPAAQPDHFRIGRGLVDEHQSGGIKHGLPSLPASTCPGHVRAILLRGAQV